LAARTVSSGPGGGEGSVLRLVDRIVEQIKRVLGGVAQAVGGLAEAGLECQPGMEDPAGEVGERVLEPGQLRALARGVPPAAAVGTMRRARVIPGRGRG
jgi:hypothetical protein